MEKSGLHPGPLAIGGAVVLCTGPMLKLLPLLGLASSASMKPAQLRLPSWTHGENSSSVRC